MKKYDQRAHDDCVPCQLGKPVSLRCSRSEGYIAYERLENRSATFRIKLRVICLEFGIRTFCMLYASMPTHWKEVIAPHWGSLVSRCMSKHTICYHHRDPWKHCSLVCISQYIRAVEIFTYSSCHTWQPKECLLTDEILDTGLANRSNVKLTCSAVFPDTGKYASPAKSVATKTAYTGVTKRFVSVEGRFSFWFTPRANDVRDHFVSLREIKVPRNRGAWPRLAKKNMNRLEM